MPLPTVISDISPVVGTGAAPNAGQPGGGENPSTFDDYLRLYAAFIAQLRAGSGLAASGANRVPFFDGAGALTSAADFVRDASGNVGLGTAAPGARLEISTNASNALRITKPTPSQLPSYIQDTADLSNITLQAGSTAGFFSAVEVMGWNGTGSSPRVALYTAGTERMRIDSSGHQINTPANTTPPTLTVNGQFNLTPTSNTNIRISYRGTDGVTRVANITLA